MGRLTRDAGLARSLAIYHDGWARRRRLRRFYAGFVRPGDLCFDIGAHVGDRTRCWLDLGARVLAVEPQPLLAGFLRRRFRRRLGVTILDVAVAAHPGRLALRVSRRTPTVSSASAGWVTAVRRDRSFARVVWDRRVSVPAATLDGLIGRYGVPDFCKIDVEGCEPDVLAGLSRPVPALSVEYLAAAADRALDCLDRLCVLAPYRFNLSRGESFAWEFGDWVDAETIRRWLTALPANAGSGDLYARLDGRNP